jgi:chondroitin-sulfate-ABC endolyase/exolyase
VSAGGQNGIFALRIRDFFYDPGFHALKSYFFFGNEIICLGSNIESQDPTHAVHTTLFQCAIGAAARPFILNGSPIPHSEFTWSGKSGEPLCLADPVGNAYHVPDGAGVQLRIGQQTSRDSHNRTSTQGRFATCWIDHGHLPKDLGAAEAFYHYIVIPEAGPDTLETSREPSAHDVLRRDHRAHIVRHHSSRSTAGAIFETDWMIPEGPVARTDTPILYMMQEEADGSFRLSVADPNLRLPKRRNMMFLDDEARRTKARPSEVQLLLRGHWLLLSPNDKIHLHSMNGLESLTSLRIRCAEGLTREALLTAA